MARMLSRPFKSLKHHSNSDPTLLQSSTPTKSSQIPALISPISNSSNKPSSSSVSVSSPRNSWAVYLIVSTNPPIKTYVGATNNFSRRLKQHNGELKGGAKASRAGRPWTCACLVLGFKNRSKAYEFESKWKTISRKSPPRKRSSEEQEQPDNTQVLLLQHRYAALNKVKDLFDCSDLEIDWRLDPMQSHQL